MSRAAFTPTEWEILAHRLEASDAIGDALTDSTIDESPTVPESWVEVASRADELLGIDKDSIDLDDLPALDRAILQDCCTGSTYFAGIDDAVAHGELPPGRVGTLDRAAKTLGAKLGVKVCTS